MLFTPSIISFSVVGKSTVLDKFDHSQAMCVAAAGFIAREAGLGTSLAGDGRVIGKSPNPYSAGASNYARSAFGKLIAHTRRIDERMERIFEFQEQDLLRSLMSSQPTDEAIKRRRALSRSTSSTGVLR